VVDVSGSLRLEVVVPLMAGIAEDVLATSRRAVVYDYRSADLDLPVAQLAAAVHEAATKIVRIPAAIVASESSLPYWRQYADQQGRGGVLRGVFLDPAAAVRWAVDNAALLQAQLSWYERVRSSR
jgi:hypothetical protein